MHWIKYFRHGQFRFSLGKLFVLVAIVAGYFPFRSAYTEHVKSLHAGFYLHSVLGEGVRNGDNFKKVAFLFDRHESLTKEQAIKHSNRLTQAQEGDAFFLFFLDGTSNRAFFQFRENQVVNHCNSDFLIPYASVQHFNDRPPNAILQLGPFCLYVLLVNVALVVWGAVEVVGRCCWTKQRGQGKIKGDAAH